MRWICDIKKKFALKLCQRICCIKKDGGIMLLTILLLITNLSGSPDFKETPILKSTPITGPNTKQEALINSSSKQPMVWDELKLMTQAEKENTLIDIYLTEKTNKQAEQLVTAIKNAWADGNYDYAFELFENLAKVTDPNLLELGKTYKVPIIQGNDWGGDVRIGTMDSINLVCLDFEADSSRIYAIVASNYTPTRRYEVHRSVDGGATWSLTRAWSSTTGDAYRDIDLTVAKGFFFVTDVYGNTVRVRRYLTSTGNYDSTRTVFTGTASDSCYDVAITSDVDQYPSNWWSYLVARIGNNIYAKRSLNQGLTWDNEATIGTNAIGRIDICFAQSSGASDLYVPFFKANDSLYVARNTSLGGSGSWQTPVNTGRQKNGIYANAWPSVAAFGDTAIILYEYYYNPDVDIRYVLSSNSGVTWDYGTVFASAVDERYPNVTGRKGKGWAAVCVYDVSNTCNIRFRNAVSYSTPSFTNTANLADTIARYNVCPAVEYYDLPNPRWGVVYSTFSPYEWAWFDYNRTGIQEIPHNNITTTYYLNCYPNPSRNPKIEFEIPYKNYVNVGIYDASGRIVKTLIDNTLTAGRRTIAWDRKDEQGKYVSQGIYFVKLTTETGNAIKKLLTLY